jgi:predicted small secreted protein
MSILSQLRTVSIPAAVVLASVMLGGCYTEGGFGFNIDQHVYVSRPWQPWTVTLRDTRTGQEFWSMDVPVGKKLIVKFEESTGSNDKYTPDVMKWALVDEDRETGVSITNSLSCPPANGRRLEPTLRTAPELPENMVTVTKGTLPPAKVQTVRPSAVTMPPPARPQMNEDQPKSP